MTPDFKLNKQDIDRLNKLMVENAAAAKRTLWEETNQRLLNIAGRMIDGVKPGAGVKPQRQKVKTYLNEQLSTKVKLMKSGKRKGKFASRGRRENQLQRVHLIAQAKNARKGLKGLYGETMRFAASKLRKRASSSVGYLKAPFKPVVQFFNQICRFKVPYYKTKGIGLWGLGKTKSDFVTAQNTNNPHAGFHVSAEAPSQSGAYAGVAGNAVRAESNEIARHMKERIKKQMKVIK